MFVFVSFNFFFFFTVFVCVAQFVVQVFKTSLKTGRWDPDLSLLAILAAGDEHICQGFSS